MNHENTNISDLMTVLRANPDTSLKFYFDDSAINPGYHVTEVRHATIKSRDCGKNSSTEQWNEIIIQLLDGSPKSAQGYMSTAKFMGIVGTAIESMAVEATPFLFFEFAPENDAIRKLSIESIERDGEEITVSFGSERAVCKPLQRSKATRAPAAVSLGVADPASTEGCCSNGSRSDRSSCCG